MPSNSQSAKRSRTSGHNFERKIVRILKDRFQERSWAKNIRRSDQSHMAVLPDVVGPPGLWLECQSAQRVEPAKKLAQATRDCRKGDVPVAILNQKAGAGSHDIRAYLTLGNLLKVLGQKKPRSLHGSAVGQWRAERVIAIELGDFLELYDAGPLADDIDAKIRR